MSATIVSSLYEAIVNDVIEQSRADFQDDGIDEATLQEFKSRWSAKIAATGATTIPEVATPPSVKQEDTKNEMSNPPQAQLPQGGNALAAMRAAQQIQQLQARSNGVLQQHNADSAVAQIMQQAQQSTNGTDSQAPSRVGTPANGNIETIEVKMEPDLPNSMGSSDMIMSTSQQSSSPRKRALSLKSSEHSEQVAQKPKKVKAPRNDIDLDDEAINSDLDDSDDDALRAEGDDEEESDVQTVLCLYDKVQRTKNKWKCVLKDGIVNVNGRDFAFNKANGEFEW